MAQLNSQMKKSKKLSLIQALLRKMGLTEERINELVQRPGGYVDIMAAAVMMIWPSVPVTVALSMAQNFVLTRLEDEQAVRRNLKQQAELGRDFIKRAAEIAVERQHELEEMRDEFKAAVAESERSKNQQSELSIDIIGFLVSLMLTEVFEVDGQEYRVSNVAVSLDAQGDCIVCAQVAPEPKPKPGQSQAELDRAHEEQRIQTEMRLRIDAENQRVHCEPVHQHASPVSAAIVVQFTLRLTALVFGVMAIEHGLDASAALLMGAPRPRHDHENDQGLNPFPMSPFLKP